MLIGLLRHGEVKGGPCFRGSTDDPLTENGLNQMRVATQGTQRWKRVITSPLRRCADFAGTFAMQHNLPVTIDERIAEMHFGTWEGLTAVQIMADDPDGLTRFWSDPIQHTPPRAEPLLQFQSRVLAAWAAIINPPAADTLVITHGGVIRVLLGHLRQQPLAEVLQIEVNLGELHSLHLSGNEYLPQVEEQSR